MRANCRKDPAVGQNRDTRSPAIVLQRDRRCEIKQEKRVYIGIDISKHQTHYAVRRADGQVLERHRSYDNSRKGYEQAKAWLLDLLAKQAAEGVVIGGEATSYYWLPLYIQLAQDEDWAPYEMEPYLLNARWVKWFRKSHSPNNKTDQDDPGEIAEYVRLQPPKTTWKFEERWLPLRFLTRLRVHLVKSLTREKNLFDMYLFLAQSTYTQYRPFSKTLCKTSQKLLAHPEQLRQWGGFDLDTLEKYLGILSGNHLPHPRENAIRLQKVLRESFPLAGELEEPICLGLTTLLSTIRSLEGQIEQVETWIAQRTQPGYPEVAWLDSVPGVGPFTASGIAAEIGDLSRFSSVPFWDPRRMAYRPRTSGEVADAVCKYAGLWWPKNASGQFVAEEHPLSREGNAYLRYYVLEAADQLRRVIPSYTAFYQRKYKQAAKHKHKRALVLTGCKALELFVTLLRRQEPFKAKEALPALP